MVWMVLALMGNSLSLMTSLAKSPTGSLRSFCCSIQQWNRLRDASLASYARRTFLMTFASRLGGVA